ncbi:MAG: alpha-amylase family glycosyl hydrolase, partial [Oscillospiraceae bacterium]|nr:alpha-amylase family glycosyl hydrolase [Oscillospiraceae bacterium]
MRTTKKIVASVLAVCMLASTSLVTAFAANSGDEEVGANNYNLANQAVDTDYTYTGGDLGANYSPEKTVFKVWAPKSTEVTLNRYATGSDSEPGAENLGTVPMEKLMDGDKWTGVWTATVEGDIVNTYYTYTITSTLFDKSGKALAEPQVAETQDVYSVATGVNGRRSMVCDLDSTDPEGWDKDVHIVPDQQTDSQVWEVHVKDFTWDKNSGVSEQNRGKYLGFTETGTTLNGEGNVSTCIDYLKQLGVTTVQINPFYDFQSINEAGSDDQFNWGYDPQNYNVPEGSYSSNPYDGNVRINECKQMIKALHDAGISVVMDVVYNHTYSCSAADSCFQATVPNYYHRMRSTGVFSDGSGCGNEVATEFAMTRQYIVDSCKYWVNEYHVDGFRFDLMGLMDVECMNQIRAELDEINPKLTTWGEGWTGGT